MKIKVGSDEFEVNDSSIITFSDGLLGFPECKRFVIFDYESDTAPFKWMQSVEDTNIGFIIMDPTLVKPDYQPAVPAQDIKSLGTDDVNDIIILVILTAHSDKPADSTVNLNGPLLINEKNMQAKQVVLIDNNYSYTQSIVHKETNIREVI